MEKVLLDTNVYSLLTTKAKKAGGEKEKFTELYKQHLLGSVLGISFVTVAEQYFGYHKMIDKGEWAASRLSDLELQLQRVLVIPYDIEICKTFGRLRAQLKNPDGSHRTIADNDLWISACAVRHSLRLATHNRKHFENIPGLDIICEAP